MKYCTSCGNKLKKESKFCDKCGEKIGAKNTKTNSSKKVDETTKKINELFENIMDTKDETKSFTKKDIENNKIIALLSYIGLLVLIPYFGAKDSKFAQYHAKQGINLLIVWFCYAVFSALMSLIKVNGYCGNFFGHANYCQITPWWINVPLGIIGIMIGIIAIVGIVNAVSGKAKELPLIGNINILQ